MNTAHTRRHWSVAHREAKEWHAAVASGMLLTGQKRPKKPLQKARGVFVRHSAKEPDFENLAQSFKPIIDGLVKHGVLEDDAPKNLERDYQWQKAKRGEGHIEIIVESV